MAIELKQHGSISVSNHLTFFIDVRKLTGLEFTKSQSLHGWVEGRIMKYGLSRMPLEYSEEKPFTMEMP